MYEFQLSQSYIPAQEDAVVLETTVGGVLRETASRTPEAEALVEVNMEGQTARRWTYRELLAESERLAQALATRFKPGEHITVWAPNIPEWVVMEYACALAGLVLVTANPAYQAKELEYVLRQSASVALFSVKSYRGNPMADIALQATENLPDIREMVDMEDPAALFHMAAEAVPLPDVKPSDAAQIQYTSGTTGFPKGAVLSHRGLTNNARYFNLRTRTDQQASWLNFMPMFHTSGCAVITLGAVQAGCRMLIVKVFDPIAVLDLIEQEKITALLGVPTMLVGMLEALQSHKRDMSSLTMAISGGSMVAPELVRNVCDAFGCEFETVYGQTETYPLISQHHHNDTIEDICTTVGQPMPQTETSIRSVDDNSVVAIDTVGEICVRGYCTMIGYHANEAATSETIDAEGWLHTGDLGAMDSRGYLRITGRVKEMIIRGGENLFPAEIENILLEHPSVAEVAIVGIPDPKWGEIVACFVRPEPGAEADHLDLRRHCREHMSPQKTPATWCFVKEFPLTGSGKIQKFVLRDRYVAGDYDALN
ncbi:AMP-binding protein [Sneathiella marina]|uniref:AMP-binding protein n=1 Tax=Sneathiella marina TaxID=2950108 RepID=A0ABY4W0F3_9PROT|nr:AMP-binding protein [Sneathiella marina]USG60687.1 AMP-binding protein [Sneathiella marina]